MITEPILAALTDTHLYFADKFLNLDIDTFGVASHVSQFQMKTTCLNIWLVKNLRQILKMWELYEWLSIKKMLQ